MAKLIVEFIGTFFLVLTIGMTVIAPTPEPGAFAPLAIGSVLMVMVYAGGYISGAHYNPAVTLAVWVRGRCSIADLLGYWVVQVLGGLAAALIVLYLKNQPSNLTAIKLNVMHVLVAEFLFTFALAYVVLNVATAKGTMNNSNYGLAIGFTVVAGAYAVGPISGGAFNPAVVGGLTLMGLLPLKAIWVHLLADLAGGAAAGLLFRVLNPNDR